MLPVYGNSYVQHVLPASHTTPSPVQVQTLFHIQPMKSSVHCMIEAVAVLAPACSHTCSSLSTAVTYKPCASWPCLLHAAFESRTSLSCVWLPLLTSGTTTCAVVWLVPVNFLVHMSHVQPHVGTCTCMNKVLCHTYDHIRGNQKLCCCETVPTKITCYPEA